MARGDVHQLRAPRAARGREQRGHRYGVVLQSTRFLALSTVIVAPTSSSVRSASFRPAIELQGEVTRVLVEQLCALDHSRLGDRVGSLAAEDLAKVDRAHALLLGLRTA